jgi:hypothetical protein
MLVIRDQVTDALSRSLRNSASGLNLVPGLLRRALIDEAWKERIVHQTKQHIPGFPSFRVYVETDVPEGLGATCELVERMLRDDSEALALFRAATTGKPGAHNHNIMRSRQGTSRAYTLDRLKRDRPDLFDRVKANNLSANAAAIEAGWRKKAAALDLLRKAWARATPQERAAFLAEIDRLERDAA